MENNFINPVRNSEQSRLADFGKKGVPNKYSEHPSAEILEKEISTEGISNGVKITSAVYKLLDLWPEGDPLKNKAKEKALAILENLTLVFDSQGWISLKSYLSPNREKNINQVIDDIEILENYLKVAKYQGWIDSVNFLIVVKEYSKIKEEINNKKGSFEKKLMNASNTKKEVQNKESVMVESNQLVSGEYSKRQEEILLILKEKGKAQVSDIIKKLPSVTKRTIRRDLDGLLKKDKIIRKGEFNQIFYQIAKN